MKKDSTPHLLCGKKNITYLTPLKKDGGFTLVETLVAISIFAMAVTIISGLFVQAVRGQRRNLAYQELLDQTSYVMEYMSRSIRMAMKDDVKVWGYQPRNCLAGDKVNYEFSGNCLKFRNYKDECQYFCLAGAGLVTATTTSVTVPPSFTNLTSPNLTVSSFNVGLSGEGQGDNLQPLVTINLEIRGRENTNVQIQTSISQRNLDTQQ